MIYKLQDEMRFYELHCNILCILSNDFLCYLVLISMSYTNNNDDKSISTVMFDASTH